MPEPASTPLLPKENDAARKKKRLPFIQGLRFVAVGWIVLYHYCAYDLSSAFGRWATGFPLDMFTVVSGFVTHLAYRSRDVEGALAFLCQRSVRLIFIYYFSSILTLAIKMTNHSLDQSASVGLVDDLLAFVPDIFALNAWFALVYVVPVPGVAGQFMQEAVFPTNAPLWYVQALAFCWIAYPTFHRAISSLRGDQHHIMMLAGLLFLASLLPLALYLIFPYGSLFQFLKVWPPLMIPSFLVGCTVCELYLVRGQEGNVSQNVHDEEERKPSWHAHGTLMAEAMLILYVLIVTFAPLDGDFMIHGFTLFWGVAIFLFASCPGWASQGDDGGKAGYSLGLRWLLEADFVIFAGDISLQVYALQRPLSILWHWMVDWDASKPGWIHVGWMSPFVFCCFFVALHCLAYIVAEHLDKPATEWIVSQLSTGANASEGASAGGAGSGSGHVKGEHAAGEQ